MEEVVKLKIEDNIAIITLNRPKKRNALNLDLLNLLCNTLKMANSDDLVKVIIITGNGSAFCSGIDLNAISTENIFNPTDENMDLSQLMTACHKPIIGAINGVAITGGLEIALNCDFLIASNEASFVDSNARVGIHPGWGVIPLLQQAIGQRRAKQMSFTCQLISAKIAYEWGLVNEIVPSHQLISRTIEVAKNICRNEIELISTIYQS